MATMFRTVSSQCRNVSLLYPHRSQNFHIGVSSSAETLKGSWYPPHQYHHHDHQEGPHIPSMLQLDEIPPKKAKVVVCGGGMVGTSVLYHLAMLGWGADTVMLEQESQKLAQQVAEAGQDIGWKQCGGLHLARTRDRLMYFRKMKSIAETRGTECYILTPEGV